MSQKERRRARRCLTCPLCRRARKKQRGVAYWLVRGVEGAICPYCRAYERLTGQKAHEPLSPEAAARLRGEG